MTRTQVRTVALVVSALAVSLFARPLMAAERVPSERLLPPKVYGYLSVPDVTQLKERFKQSTLGGVLEDDAFDDFWDELKPLLEEASGDITEKLGVTLDDLLAIPTGELAVAYAEPANKPAGLVGLLNFGESRPIIDKLLEKADEELEKEGVVRSVEEVDGTEIIVYRFKQAEEDDADNDRVNNQSSNDSFGSTLAYFIRDDYLVAGSNLPILEAVLARWDGEHSSTFATDETYRYVMDRTSSTNADPMVKFYVDPVSLVTKLVGTFTDDPNIQMATAFLPALGISNLKAIGGTFDMVTGDYDSVTRAFVYVEQPVTGLLNVLRFPEVAQSPPEWVAADVNTYFGLNWDVQSAYEAVETLVDTFQGPGGLEQLLDEMAEQEGGLQLHLKNDVLDQLTGSIHYISDMEDPNVVDSARYAVALGVKDSSKAQSVLAALSDAGLPVETREFRGAKIYEMELPLPAVGGLGQGTEPPMMGMTVAKDHLFIASNVTLLEQVLRGGGESLVSTNDYKRMAAHFPGKTSILGYQDQSSQFKAAYELLRSGSAGDIIEGLDLSKLPPFEAIEKYLPPTATYIVPDDSGALMVSFSLPED